MKATVVGIRRNVVLQDRDYGNRKGSTLHIAYADKEVEGTAVKKLFISECPTSHIEPGKEYDFVYEADFNGRARLVRIDEAD